MQDDAECKQNAAHFYFFLTRLFLCLLDFILNLLNWWSLCWLMGSLCLLFLLCQTVPYDKSGVLSVGHYVVSAGRESLNFLQLFTVFYSFNDISVQNRLADIEGDVATVWKDKAFWGKKIAEKKKNPTTLVALATNTGVLPH